MGSRCAGRSTTSDQRFVSDQFGGDPSRITLLVSMLTGMALGLWVLSILFCGVAALLVLIGTGLMELLAERRG